MSALAQDLDMTELICKVIDLRVAALRPTPAAAADSAALRRALWELGDRGPAGRVLQSVFADLPTGKPATRRGSRIRPGRTPAARHDPLTGLLDRTTFVERLRRITGRSIAVILIGVDDLQMINNALGPEAGDALLRSAADRLVKAAQPGSVLARLGGDEFAIVVDSPTDPAAVRRCVKRILHAFEPPLAVDAYLFGPTASAGVAISNGSNTVDDLLRQAFLALSAARRCGRGRWRQYEPPMQAEALQRLRLHAELDRAVNDRSFTLAYQPVIDLRSGELTGFEALLRWEHPRLGVIPPRMFIDTAEQTGLIVPIGSWVLANAVRTAAQWQRETDGGPAVSVNVSARQLYESGLADATLRYLDEIGLPPDRLTLELTESLLLPVGELMWRDLTRLRRHGVRIAIDDFGTGYSSLSYLPRLPVDIIKIDRCLIRNLPASPQQTAVVESIIHLAQRLGLQVVAEGIEQPNELVALGRMGCDFGQGFLFSRPLDAVDAADRARSATWPASSGSAAHVP